MRRSVRLLDPFKLVEVLDLRKSAIVNFLGTVSEAGEESKLTIFPEYCEALGGLESFSHIIVLYWLHKRDTPEERRVLKVTPRCHLGAPEVGVFASRSPTRPNPIAYEVCKILSINGCALTVEGSDAFRGTPILDIKPYIPRADSVPDAWTPEWTNHGPKT